MDEVLCFFLEVGKVVFGNFELLSLFFVSFEEEEIDVVDWILEGRLVFISFFFVWFDFFLELEIEVDILT